jgi:hypothetical protein
MFAIKTFGIIFIYAMASIGWGSLLIKVLGIRNDHKIASNLGLFFTISYILGLIIQAFIWLFLSITFLFLPSIVWGFCLIGNLLFFFCFPFYIIARREVVTNKTKRKLFYENDYLIIYVGLVLLFFLTFFTLGRELSSDAAELYMAWPKLIANTHGLITYPARSISSTIGLFGEFHYAAMIALGSPDACRLTDIILLLCILLLIYQLCKRFNIKHVGLSVIYTILFTSTAFLYLIGKGTSDLYAFVLGLTTVVLVFIAIEENDQASWIIAGLVFGTCLISKLSYILCFIPTIATLIVLLKFENKEHSDSKQKFFKSLLSVVTYFALGSFIGALLFFIKNIYLFSNPFISFTPWANQLLDFPIFKSKTDLIRIILFYPFMLTYGKFPLQSGNLSPIFLCFLPLSVVLFRKRIDKKTKNLIILTVSSLVGMVAWVCIRPNVLVPRYFFINLLLLSFLPSAGMELVFQQNYKSYINVMLFLVIIYVN